jgi:AcrR family transcriptional regulator
VSTPPAGDAARSVPAPGPSGVPERHGRRGRPRDPSRDAVILGAAYDVLAETGYEDMTLSAVAARAGAGKATLHRRWPTKEALVLAVIAHVGPPPEAGTLPDTGDLRSDLLALVDSAWLGGAAPRLRGLKGLTSAALHSPRLARALQREVVEPYVEAYRGVLRRGVQRGQLAADLDTGALAEVVPALATHRLLFADVPPERAYFETVIDDVLLPACTRVPATGA